MYIPPPPPPAPIMMIQKDAVGTGIILTAKCSAGYPPYAYLWIARGTLDYYSRMSLFLNQQCILPEKKKAAKGEK